MLKTIYITLFLIFQPYVVFPQDNKNNLNIKNYFRLALTDCVNCQAIVYDLENIDLNTNSYLLLDSKYQKDYENKFNDIDENHKFIRLTKLYDNVLFNKLSTLPNSTYHIVLNDTLVLDEGTLKDFSVKWYKQNISPMISRHKNINKNIFKDTINDSHHLKIINDIVVLNSFGKLKKIYFPDSILTIKPNLDDSFLESAYLSFDKKNAKKDFINRKQNVRMKPYPNYVGGYSIGKDDVNMIYNLRYLRTKNKGNDTTISPAMCLLNANKKGLISVRYIDFKSDKYDFINNGGFFVKNNNMYLSIFNYKKRGDKLHFLIRKNIMNEKNKNESIKINTKNDIINTLYIPEEIIDKAKKNDIDPYDLCDFVEIYPYILFKHYPIMINLESGNKIKIPLDEISENNPKYVSINNAKIHENKIKILFSQKTFKSDSDFDRKYFLVEYDFVNNIILKKSNFKSIHKYIDLIDFFSIYTIDESEKINIRYLPVKKI